MRGGAAARAARRLPQRRHGRVPLRARGAALLLHGGQRAAAGRAPGDRGGHRARPRQAAASRRRRRAARGRAAAARRATRSRRGSTPRTRRSASRRRPAESRCCGCRPGPGVRVDTGVAEGDVIPAEFDSMIAKLIAWGRDREEALARLRRALADTIVVVDGGTTNQGFLLELLGRPEVRTGEVDTTWLDRLHLQRRDRARAPRRRRAAAGGDRAGRRRTSPADRARFYAFARRGRPQASAELRAQRRAAPPRAVLPLAVAQIAPGALPRDGRRRARSRSTSQRLGAHERRLELRRPRSPHADLDPGRGPARRGRRRAAPDLARRRRARAQPRARRSSSRSRSRAGDEVEAGRRRRGRRGDEDGDVADRAVPRPRPAGARRRRTCTWPRRRRCSRSSRWTAGRPRRRASASRSRRRSRRRAAVAPERCRENLRRLEWLVLGYDIDAAEVERIDRRPARRVRRPARLRPGARSPASTACCDVRGPARAVASARHDEAEPETPLLPSPQEHLHAWLRSLDAEAEGLPATFVDAAPARARALRGREPRAHAGARGGVLPPVPLPAAGRDGARARSWRSSTGASSRPSSSPDTSATTSARRSTGW